MIVVAPVLAADATLKDQSYRNVRQPFDVLAIMNTAGKEEGRWRLLQRPRHALLRTVDHPTLASARLRP